MRSIVYRYEDLSAFGHALERDDQRVELPAGETVGEGEWVLAIFEIGPRRRTTAAAARGTKQGTHALLAFEPRDWTRLTSFASARSEHMRAARPDSQSRMPAADPLSVRSPDMAAELAPISGQFAAAVQARILLVDDDDETRDVVSCMLQGVGLLVDVAASAEEALDKARAASFDLMVLDVNLPGMTGLDLCREIRREGTLSSTPVLFLSSHNSSRDIVDAFASGADDFVAKPFRAPELGARIFGLLRRARLGKSNEYPTRA